MLRIHQIDPLEDPRWGRFLLSHPAASVFHSPGWLEALRRTYGFSPVVLTTCSSNVDQTDGLVFCFVNSALSGRRLVSLPFSDHCEPLVRDPNELLPLLCAVRGDFEVRRLGYIEIRPVAVRLVGIRGFGESKRFWLHRIDLRPHIGELFRSFHKDCVQRKIRRAEREALVYEEGRSERLLRSFYRLLVYTSKRQRRVPQPYQWFKNLTDCLGSNLKIRLASRDGQPLASIVTLRYKDRMVYKYGSSDARHHALGGMPFLFWRAIEDAKEEGLREFDLGRTDCNDEGLATFKDRLGGRRSVLTYWRSPAPGPEREWPMRVARKVIAHMPERILPAVGSLAYRHLG